MRDKAKEAVYIADSVPHLHGFVGLIMHLRDFRWGAESANYMASLA